MRLVLYQPDIPQNAGAMMRLAACMGVPIDLIEPCGFVLDDRRLRRAGMDYLESLDMTRHTSWEAYGRSGPAGRLVLLTTAGTRRYTEFAFDPGDRIMVGRESDGVPAAVRDGADACLRIPLRADTRSLNVALAAAMVLGEGMRQTDGFARDAE